MPILECFTSKPKSKTEDDKECARLLRLPYNERRELFYRIMRDRGEGKIVPKPEWLFMNACKLRQRLWTQAGINNHVRLRCAAIPVFRGLNTCTR